MKDKCYVNKENYIKSKDLYEKLDKNIERLEQELSAVKKEKEEKLIEYRKSMFTVGKKLRLINYGYNYMYGYSETYGTITYYSDNFFILQTTGITGIRYFEDDIVTIYYYDLLKYFDSIEIIEDK